MKQKIVGSYCIGNEQCQLVITEGTGGIFYACPEEGHIPRIKIGVDYEEWWKVVRVLLHEAYEFVLFRNNCRYEPSNDFGSDHAGYVFIMNHPQFSDCCGKVADFISNALPDLAREWKKWNKKTLIPKKT